MRAADSGAVTKLREAIQGGSGILVGDVVLLEVLQGARSEQHAERLRGQLHQFHIVPMMDAKLAVLASRHYRLLRERGITIRRTVDLIIGTFCIAHGYKLLHQDRDFAPMATHLGLLTI